MQIAKDTYLEAVMETVLDGLITIDKTGTIQTINSSAVKTFGYEKHEVIGQNVRMLMPEPYQSEHDGYLANFISTGDKKIIGIGREILAMRKDGSIFPMELGVNQTLVDGELMFVGTIRDISERKETERSIQSYIEKLKLSNQELDQFAYIASHDLKEPLRGLSNNASFLHEDFAEQLNEQGAKRLDRMRFLCHRMERLVDDLLHYSRLGRQELAIVNADLNQVIKSVEELTVAQDAGSGAQIKVPQALPHIVCDLPKITELFRNLISNAIKYNRQDQKLVEVGITSMLNPITQSQEPRVFYVKDNGIGIENRFYADVFRIFKRLNDEDDSVRGTGVGLTFVKKIVERHKGHIWLESEPGLGTCFYFTLNVDDAVHE